MTPQQKEIMRLFDSDYNKELTKKEIVDRVAKYCYNTSKHVGDRLARLVRQNLLIRTRKSVYRLSKGRINGKRSTIIENQMQLRL